MDAKTIAVAALTVAVLPRDAMTKLLVYTVPHLLRQHHVNIQDAVLGWE